MKIKYTRFLQKKFARVLYADEETVTIGVCAHLNEKDSITSTHCVHGHCIAKGCDLKGMKFMGKPIKEALVSH